mgnify:CR=1 FL=1
MDKKYLPVNLDITQFKSLVIGGGKIAYRKALTLLKYGSSPAILSPEVIEPMEELIKKHNLIFINRKYQGKDIENFKLVFVATGDPEADKLIKEDCDEANVLVNVADVPELCNFIMPATVKRGDLTLAIGSGGKAPFYVKEIRKRLQSEFPKQYEVTIQLAGEFREYVMQRKDLSQKARNELFDMFNSENWIEIIKTEGLEKARTKIKDIAEIIK